MTGKCKHIYQHRWNRVASTNGNGFSENVSYSCMYYWKNPHLIKGFLSQHIEIYKSVYTKKFPYKFDQYAICFRCKEYERVQTSI